MTTVISEINLTALKTALHGLSSVSSDASEADSKIAYHKYQTLWGDALQRSITLVLLIHFISTVNTRLFPEGGDDSKPENPFAEALAELLQPQSLSTLLASPSAVAQELGVQFSHVYTDFILPEHDSKEQEDKESRTRAENSVALKDATQFHISVPNYLHAVISVCNELARLSYNSVTTVSQLETLRGKTSANDLYHKSDDQKTKDGAAPSPYFLPVVIAAFLKQVQAAFLILDLKNDGLRRHMDTLKYDVKNAEQVVYDLSLRDLI